MFEPKRVIENVFPVIPANYYEILIKQQVAIKGKNVMEYLVSWFRGLFELYFLKQNVSIPVLISHKSNKTLSRDQQWILA